MSVRVNVCMSRTRVQNHAYVNESSRTFVRDVRQMPTCGFYE